MRILKILFASILEIKKYLKNLNRKTFLLFWQEPILMRRIISVLDGFFCIRNKKLFLKLPNRMTFAVKNAGVIDVISEIFFFNNYNFNSKSNFIALDIGMNVGVASLFFASFENS